MTDTAKKEHKSIPRTHFEGLGHQWSVLVGNPAKYLPQIVGTVIHSGGTRECWQRKDSTKETILMAWPKEEPLKAGVIMQGLLEKDMKPVSAMPLLRGLPNDLMVDSALPWKSGVEGHVSATIFEGRNPMWFYDPLFFRDKDDLTPGVTHTFLLAGLAFGVRKALLDEMTITQGPIYEEHVARWLAAYPDKTRLDVPVMKVPLAGKQIIMPGRNFCEYEVRNTLAEVEKTKLDKVDVYMLRMLFPLEGKAPLDIMVYAPVHLFKEYEPQVGDEVDAYVWLQGCIIDE